VEPQDQFQESKVKITKAQFDSLTSDTITKKEYDYIINRITDRCDEIVLKMLESEDPNFWWDFGNCDFDSEESEGVFDPQEYKEFVNIGGEHVNFPEPYGGRYDAGFPTRWLWEDWELEFNEEVKAHMTKKLAKKEKIKKQKETRKHNREALRASAFAKLTPEERKAVGLGGKEYEKNLDLEKVEKMESLEKVEEMEALMGMQLNGIYDFIKNTPKKKR
jgi:hypothetical protein